MLEHFCVLQKSEFVSLINNLELKGIPFQRLFSEPNQLKETLLKAPQLDYDEDYIVIKIERKDDKEIKDGLLIVHIHNTLELIPITEIAFLGYKRKFSDSLQWTDPSKYNFEEFYKEYLDVKMQIDSMRNFELCQKHRFTSDGNLLIPEDLLFHIIQAKIDKQLKGKIDIQIKENDYKHVYESLMLYEQGSHFQRENAFGFLLHAIGVFVLHYGHGPKLREIRKLRETKFIKTLKEINAKKKFKFFNEIFSDSDINNLIEGFKSNSNEFLFKGHIKQLKVISYYLFYYFLLHEKKKSFLTIIESVNQFLGEIYFSEEEETAFLLIAINCSSLKIAEDIMFANENLSFISSKNHCDWQDLQLLGDYYGNKKQQSHTKGKISETKKDTSESAPANIESPVPEVKKILPAANEAPVVEEQDTVKESVSAITESPEVAIEKIVPAIEEPVREEPVREEPVPAVKESLIVKEVPVVEEQYTVEASVPPIEEYLAEAPVKEVPVDDAPVTAAEAPVVEEQNTVKESSSANTEVPAPEVKKLLPAVKEAPVAEEQNTVKESVSAITESPEVAVEKIVPAIEKPVEEEPVKEAPIVEEPITGESVTEEPIAEEPLPAIEAPVVEAPVDKKRMGSKVDSSNTQSELPFID
ncbi:MAG: hypothetical protein K9I84_16820 [Leadbetterella sp.]|nr:hypothetical protein [Leadbetterella sp.]